MADNEFMDLLADLKGQLEAKFQEDGPDPRIQRENSLLEEINTKICSSLDSDEVISFITENTCKLLLCERITIYTIERSRDGTGRELVSRHLTGGEVREIRVPYNHNSLAGYTACTGKTLRINDVYDDDEIFAISPQPKFDKSWDSKTGYRTRSMLVSPIKRDEYVVGVIQALNKRQEGTFDEHDEDLIRQVARHVVSALESVQTQTRVIKKTRARVSINDLLVSKGIISAERLSAAMEKSRVERRKLLEILVEQFDVPEVEVTKCLAEMNEVEFISFSKGLNVDPMLFDNVPEIYAKRHLICPLKAVTDTEGHPALHLAMHNPKDFVALEDVEIRTGMKVRQIFMATKADLLALIHHTLHPDQAEGDKESLEDIKQQLISELAVDDDKTAVEAVEVQEGVTENEGPVVKLANRIIEEAVRRGATDIHIEPMEREVLVRYRIDGSLEKSLTFPFHARKAIISRFKIMAECNITEHRVPQDGRIRFKQFGGRYDIELRVNICPTVGGNEDIVMRILADNKPPPLEKMGFMPYSFNPVRKALDAPYGMILCVGPTGSGKTTTLHSAVAAINTPDTKILTAENPVEITQAGLRQVQIKPEVGLTFKEALRAFLRQDPDVIMVGEMRDLETCSIAVEAALTGHMLLSTLHTNNAPETVTRLIDIGIDRVTLSDALLLVIAQRLGKRLCGKCKKPYTPTDAELADWLPGFTREGGGIKYRNELIEKPEFYTPGGCDECQGRGFKGRFGVHEVLVNLGEVKRLVAQGAKVREIRKVAKLEGMKELFEDGMIKMANGWTTPDRIRGECGQGDEPEE